MVLPIKGGKLPMSSGGVPEVLQMEKEPLQLQTSQYKQNLIRKGKSVAGVESRSNFKR